MPFRKATSTKARHAAKPHAGNFSTHPHGLAVLRPAANVKKPALGGLVVRLLSLVSYCHLAQLLLNFGDDALHFTPWGRQRAGQQQDA